MPATARQAIPHSSSSSYHPQVPDTLKSGAAAAAGQLMTGLSRVRDDAAAAGQLLTGSGASSASAPSTVTASSELESLTTGGGVGVVTMVDAASEDPSGPGVPNLPSDTGGRPPGQVFGPGIFEREHEAEGAGDSTRGSEHEEGDITTIEL